MSVADKLLRMAKRFTGSALVSFGGAILAFAVAYVAIRVLGRSGFGEYAIAISMLELVGLPLIGGQRIMLMREFAGVGSTERAVGASAEETSGYVISLVWRATFVVVAIGLVFGVVMTQVNGSGVWPAFIAGMFGLPFAVRSGIGRALLLAADRVIPAQRPDLVDRRITLLAGFGAVLILFGDVDSWIAMALFSSGHAVSMLTTDREMRVAELRYPSIRSTSIEPAKRKELRTSMGQLAITQLSTKINTRADTVMIGAISSVDQAALYALARRVLQLLNLPFQSARIATMPLLAKMRRRDEGWERAASDMHMMSFAGFASTAIGALVILAIPAIILEIFDKDFGSGATALRILALEAMVGALAGPVGAAMSLFGYEKIVARWVMASAATNVALNLVLINQWGAAGAATASLISAAMWNSGLVVSLMRRTGVSTCCALKSKPHADLMPAVSTS